MKLNIYGFLMVICLIVFAQESEAQRHIKYCDEAMSLADLQLCVNDHKKEAQEALNIIYETLDKHLNEEQRVALKVAQDHWITFRDAECAWEKSLAPNPAQERLYELSCLATLTDMRSDLIAQINIDALKNQAENDNDILPIQPKMETDTKIETESETVHAPLPVKKPSL